MSLLYRLNLMRLLCVVQILEVMVIRNSALIVVDSDNKYEDACVCLIFKEQSVDNMEINAVVNIRITVQ